MEKKRIELRNIDGKLLKRGLAVLTNINPLIEYVTGEGGITLYALCPSHVRIAALHLKTQPLSFSEGGFFAGRLSSALKGDEVEIGFGDHVLVRCGSRVVKLGSVQLGPQDRVPVEWRTKSPPHTVQAEFVNVQELASFLGATSIVSEKEDISLRVSISEGKLRLAAERETGESVSESFSVTVSGEVEAVASYARSLLIPLFAPLNAEATLFWANDAPLRIVMSGGSWSFSAFTAPRVENT